LSVLKYVRVGDDVRVSMDEMEPLELQALIWGLFLTIPIRDRFAVLQRMANTDVPSLPLRIARLIDEAARDESV